MDTPPLPDYTVGSSAPREIEVATTAWRILHRGDGATRDALANDTLFPVGSATKALTVTALGVLVDEKTHTWEQFVAERLLGPLSVPFESATKPIVFLLAKPSRS